MPLNSRSGTLQDMDATDLQHVTVTIGPQGRIVLPADMRRSLGLEPGDRLVARVEDGRLVLETRAAILARLQAEFRAAAGGRDLVAELIAERREEARRELLEDER